MMAQEEKTLILEEGFPQRVFYTSLFLMALMALAAASFQSFKISFSLLAGCAVSLALCKLQWWTVRQFFLKECPTGRRTQFFIWTTLLKYCLLGLLVYINIIYLRVHVIAFLVGISLVPAVVSLKMIGILLVNYLNGPLEAVAGSLPNKDRGLRS